MSIINPVELWGFLRDLMLAFGMITVPLIAGEPIKGVRREMAKKFAWKVFRVCMIITIGDVLIGRYIPSAFGLPLGAFQAAGGVIFLIDALTKMLSKEEPEPEPELTIRRRWWHTKRHRKRLACLEEEARAKLLKRHQEKKEAALMRQASIPVAFPKLAGAAFLASVITAEGKVQHNNMAQYLDLGLAVLALLVILLTLLLNTPRIMGSLSYNGRLTFDKIASFVLLLLGINGTVAGVTRIILGVLHPELA
ncbi:MarC family protein [Ktedonospora formicarum]|uniref:UPF0056 membrane protein n=1 Tax=Ktedonospora formicarum TaxID=2778364 RepID=A0A8J3I7S4_9CHLR|nr:MarC family protein [Ktedonospora formicarum]GHO46269.1 hypothetical protein KSX_44320 [Ktedonospora formicarum]